MRRSGSVNGLPAVDDRAECHRFRQKVSAGNSGFRNQPIRRNAVFPVPHRRSISFRLDRAERRQYIIRIQCFNAAPRIVPVAPPRHGPRLHDRHVVLHAHIGLRRRQPHFTYGFRRSFPPCGNIGAERAELHGVNRRPISLFPFGQFVKQKIFMIGLVIPYRMFPHSRRNGSLHACRHPDFTVLAVERIRG